MSEREMNGPEIAAKVIDIFGNGTAKVLEVTV